MEKFRYSVDVFAPPELVWAVLTDVERWPEWTPSTTRVKRQEAGPLTVGSSAKVWQPKLMPAVWRVTELDASRSVFVWVAGIPGVTVTAKHIVGRLDQNSRVTLILDYAGLLGPLMAWQLKNLNWDYLTMEAKGLKQRCEQEFAAAARPRELPVEPF
ncbi:MAG TPA: SRPBCC family protein [Terracidiphilus sp.]|nr:SRPBCC family protein [Terracidiphilus sp.]